MKIDCPSCEASYNLPSGKIGPEGRKVRCTRCREVWRAMPENDDAVIADSMADAMEDEMKVAASGGGSGFAVVSNSDDMSDPSAGDDAQAEEGDFSSEFDAFKAALSDDPISESTGELETPIIDGSRL